MKTVSNVMQEKNVAAELHSSANSADSVEARLQRPPRESRLLVAHPCRGLSLTVM